MNSRTGRNDRIYISALLIALSLLIVSMQPPVEAQGTSPAPNVQSASVQIHALKVTLLSTMLVGSTTGVGEWGFSALIEADGHRVLLDPGAHPDTVLQNARDLKIDLSDVREVILTHNHWDHVGGLMTLRKEMMKSNPSALSVVHVARGIFYSRPAPEGEDNRMIAVKKEYEARIPSRRFSHSSEDGITLAEPLSACDGPCLCVYRTATYRWHSQQPSRERRTLRG